MESTKFSINYRKNKRLILEKTNDPVYDPFDISGIQSFIPLYTRFFDMDDTNFNKVSLNNTFQIRDLSTVYKNDEIVEKNIFVKFSPLIDPLNFLRGKYNLETEITRTLPTICSTAESCLPKLVDVNNTAYVDGFFSYLTSMLKDTHGWVHGVEYYGSYLAIQRKFRYNIADDLEFVSSCPFFLTNINKYFTIDEEAANILNQYSGEGSRRNRNKLCIEDGGDVTLDFEDLVDADSCAETSAVETPFLEYENTVAKNETVDSPSESESESSGSESESTQSDSDSTDSDSESEGSDDSESVWETESESDTGSSSLSEFEDDEEPIFSYLNNYPVQMIFQEKCAGTIDQLILRRKLNDDQFIDALMQIILILATYQKVFDFTHNDLHTNNIMYIETDIEFLYYKLEGILYKVPTNGRIYKLIDFGRAIYKFGGKLFCSDSFAASGDAATQYNCEPYFNEKKPRVDPNPSFDLSRLGCSLYDFVCRNGEPKTPLQKLVDHWCNDDYGKNMLYRHNGQTRYPDFKLYKMIARTVNNLVPKDELKSLLFSSKYIFKPEESAADITIMDIDSLPVYM
jgi:hypothetical protein